MSLLQQNNLSFNKRSRFPKPLLVAVVLIIIILVNDSALGFVSKVTYSIGGSIWKTQSVVVNTFNNIATAFKDKQGLERKNQTLHEEIDRLELSSIWTEVLRQENDSLRELLNRESEKNFIAASILTRPNQTLYDTFVVDVGRRDGVNVGARVFGVEKIAIGSVTEVYLRTSLISLYSSPGRSIDVLLGDESVSVKAVGRGGGDFEVRVPRGVDVSKGQVVLSPGLDNGVFGVVEEVVALPADSFQTILFSSPINIQSLRMVAIMLR